MRNAKCWMRSLVAAFTLGCLVATAPAEVLVDTGPPGGFFGYIGFDIFVGQSVTFGFVPEQDYTLDQLSLWIMSNDFDNPGRTYTLSLQSDNSGTTTPTYPSGTVIEQWDMATEAIGWSPILETAVSTLKPTLTAGTPYWIVAESDEQPFVDPLWVQGSSPDEHWYGFIDFASSPNWQTGFLGGSPAVVVEATPIPEPGTLVLGATGAILALAAARRRRS